MDYLSLIDIKPNRLKRKWADIKKTMSVHVSGEIPTHIFEQRRPIESQQNYTLEYRKENYRTITQSEFYKAMIDYISIAKNVDKKILWNGNEEINQYVWHGWRKVSIEDWFIDTLGYFRQLDPNSIIFCLPKHEVDFIPQFDIEIPDFNQMVNKTIELMPLLIPSEDITYIDEKSVMVKGGEWLMSNNTYKSYYWVIDSDAFYLVYPFYTDKEIKYIQHPYYNNIGDIFPVIPVGSLITTDEHGSYYLPDFFGAAAWGDMSLGQMSDLQVCEVRFTFPRHWAIKVACDNISEGCYHNIEEGCFTIADGSTCKRCKGTGYVMDMTPMGTRLIDPNGAMEDNKLNAPEGFIAPPTEILKHSAERVDSYFDKMLHSLGIFKQNETNQSGTSKSYDIIHKANTIESIVRWIFKAYEMYLNFNAMYMANTTDIEPIKIALPEKIDVMNAVDLQIKIKEAKDMGLPYSAISQMVKAYLYKTVGDSEIDKKVIDYLSKNDKLFAFGINELKDAKIILGSNIDNRDILIHQLGMQLLIDWDGIERASNEQITNYLNENLPLVEDLQII